MESAVIGVLELASIAVGIKVLDSMVKAAPVEILKAGSVCPGKFIAVITGSVAAVEMSLLRGREAGQGFLIDELFISNLHRQIIPAIRGYQKLPRWNALGILESFSATAGIEAGDAAAKQADVWIAEIRLVNREDDRPHRGRGSRHGRRSGGHQSEGTALPGSDRSQSSSGHTAVFV